MDFSGRLRFLIDRDFAGNVYRAARSWGVPQPTLHRFVEHGARRPNAGTVLKIARFYETTVEWLVEGVGPGPREAAFPIVELRGWENLVRGLALPPEAERIVLVLPGRVGVAHTVLCDWGLFNWKGKRVSLQKQEPLLRARWMASALELEAWTIWLRAVISTYGRDAVREKLLSEMDRIRLGFQRFAIFLLNTERLPKDIASIYDREAHRPGEPAGLTLINEPAAPPLNAERAIGSRARKRQQQR